MYYEVFNKQGDRLCIYYPCFGALSMIGNWFSYQGIKADGTPLPSESVKVASDVYGEVYYRKGFQPENLSHVEWYSDSSNHHNQELALDLVERCIAEHQIFKGISFNRESGVVTFPLGNRKMDETLLPVFILRDFLEEWCVQRAFTYIRESFYLDDVLTAMLLSPLFSAFTNYKKEEIFSYSYEDGCYATSHTAVGHIVDFISQRKLPEFYDKTWEETELGYGSYGTTPSYIYDEDDFIMDDEEEIEIFDNAEGVPMPTNPYTKGRATIDSCIIARHYNELSPEEGVKKGEIPAIEFVSKVLALLKEVK